ncbi:MAG: phospholipase [Muribaculaceae bacterium]|nr:phospholipase [Muribaculaceae bacterium]
MTGALVILAALVLIGLLLFITDKKYYRHHHREDPGMERRGPSAENPTSEEICCGQHLVCEKTSLSIVSDEIIYYDDEELDRFAGRAPESYSPGETEEFRDVLMTLLPEDVAGWARSITLRKIQLPSEVKDELLLLVSELRAQ